MPSYAVSWSDGRALIAVGIPVGPVEYNGVTYTIGQANNALLYPGLGLGTIVSGAQHVTDNMLLAAAQAVASQVEVSKPGASLLPRPAQARRQGLRASASTATELRPAPCSAAQRAGASAGG